jgi:hypothetical protein
LFSSCSTTPEVVEDLNNDFYAFKAEINAERVKEYKTVYDYSDLKAFLIDNSSDKNALTSSEINALKSGKTKNKSILTYQEMEEDVDLYFRVLRSHWGAYYYWGGNEKFNSVKQSILDKFKGKTSILSDDLESVMHEAMNFIVDGHFQLGSGKKAHFVSDENKYWFCYTDDVFLKDESGFYCEKEGKRYHWVGCDNPDVSIERRLFDDGTLAYGLVQFTPKAYIHDSDEIVLLCEGQEIKTTVKWTRSKPLSEDSLRNPSFKLVKSDGVSYLRLYSFDTNYVDQLEAFAKSGTSARGSGLLIFDIRSNGGGNSRYLNEWFNSYKGFQHDIKEANGRRNGDLNNSRDNSEAYSYRASQGTIINHKAPVIVLVDNNCGSSGESAYNALRTIKNSIVIGTNTSGCASFGNVVNYVLPNSGIHFVYGTDLRSFSDPMENMDGKGFLPDIWCNPSTVMTAVERMLIKYSIVNEETLAELMDKINQMSVTITMKVEGDIVNEGSGFGRGNRQFNVYILANGEQISDYEYSVTDNIGSITKQSDGALTLKATKAGDALITIKYKGNTAKFRWHNGN